MKAASVSDVKVSFTEKGVSAPLLFPNCFMKNLDNGRVYAVAGDENGICLFSSIPEGNYEISVLYFGEKTDIGEVLVSGEFSEFSFEVDITPMTIGEVVVTAKESIGNVTQSTVGRAAMEHLQPSSIADILELLPGGRSKDPSFSSAQTISIREAGISSGNYSTSALGTQFIMDGVPVSMNANMQYSPVYSNYGSSFVNYGVDMRTISTDDIESVDIVRGIASAEYGDLTSGLVNIKRKKGGNLLEARFKSDMKSKLFYAGKGFEFFSEDSPLMVNAGLGYLDAAADPRNTRQNYRRITGSFRVNRNWKDGDFDYSSGISADYTGSFDHVKSDRDLDFGTYGPIERYSSSYNRFSEIADFSVKSREKRFFRSFTFKGSISFEKDIIDRWKYVAMGSEVPISTATEEGEYNVGALPLKYEASMKVEGIPFNAFAKCVAAFFAGTEHFSNDIRTGIEWSADKNYGRGVVFDVEKPFSPDMNVRPRDFSSIPAMHRVSFFAEDGMKLKMGRFSLDAMVGIRLSTLLNLGSKYRLNGRISPDPRINVTLHFPEFALMGKIAKVSLSAGAGWHTKYPTMSYLYPDKIYYDVVQMNYWPSDPSKRLINLRVFKIDPVNYNLNPAMNFKWELRSDMSCNGHFVSAVYFRENMASGFRTSGEVSTFVVKDYDEQSVDISSLDGPPDLEKVPYVLDTLLTTYGISNNGSRTFKEGVEFTYVSPRIKAIMTRLSVSGAWFRTIYRNSLPEYYQPMSVVAGEPYPYIGYYRDTEGYLREVFNTNFMLDTQVPRLGLVFTLSFQCQWFTGSRNLWRSEYPEYYIDRNMQWHEFTKESATDGILSSLVRNSDPSLYRYNSIPFSMNVNLKVTKKIFRDKMSVSVFVNRILDCNPPYRTNGGLLVRRTVTPYFGMELNFKV